MNQRIKTILSIITLPYYLALGGRKQKYLIAPNGLGEIVGIFMYSKEYMKQTGATKVNIVINATRRECVAVLSRKDISFTCVPSWFHKLMVAYGLSIIGNRTLPKNVVFVDSWERQGRKIGNHFSQLKKLMNLNDKVGQFWGMTQEEGSKTQKIYFSPYARTLSVTDFSIYEKIVEKLTEKYECFTLLNKNQKPIKGTMPLYATLEESVEMVQQGRCLIGTRSGFIDLMSLTDTKIVCLYSEMKDDEMFFSFENCDWNNTVIEHSIKEKGLVDIILQEIESKEI